MTIAEPEETVTAPHVQAALDDCSYINNSGKEWAELDIVQTSTGQSVTMKIGPVEFGRKMLSYCVVRYELHNGQVQVTRIYHG